MGLNLLYILAGILGGASVVFGALKELSRHVRNRVEERVKRTEAIDRNTDATDRLSASLDKVGETLDNHGKRIDKLEYKVWGFNGASHS